MAKSPLDHPRLRAIERKLERGELEEAQHLLAQLGQGSFFRHAVSYLSTWLRYLQGQLDERQVVDRLSTIVAEAGEFPEAQSMLEAARDRTLSRAPRFVPSSRPPPAPTTGRRGAFDAELDRALASGSSRPPKSGGDDAPSIPRAARLPDLAPPRVPDLDLGSWPPPGFFPEPRAAEYSSARAPLPPTARRSAEGIVSAIPAVIDQSAASLFEVAELLDRGRVHAALVALERRGARDDEPDHVLMEARVRAKLGQSEAARERLVRLGRAPLLEPEIRAGVARLALELDDIELASVQARRAYDDDPAHPLVCASFAWAALRLARRTARADLVRDAARALSGLAEGGPHAALILALRACIEAHAGDAERAASLAARSLELEPSADALVALAMACARLGRHEEASRAGARLRQLSPTEAMALEAGVERHAERLFSLA